MAAKGNKVFLSYRREDAGDVAGRIRDWLVQTRRIAREDIFMDVTAILPGFKAAGGVQGRACPPCRTPREVMAMVDRARPIYVIGPATAGFLDPGLSGSSRPV